MLEPCSKCLYVIWDSIFPFSYCLLVYRNTFLLAYWSCALQLLKIFIYSNRFWGGKFAKIFCAHVHLSLEKESLYFYLQTVWLSLFPCPWLWTLGRVSNQSWWFISHMLLDYWLIFCQIFFTLICQIVLQFYFLILYLSYFGTRVSQTS